jgi:hypothetical protein
MKTMTCRQLGGACDKEFHAETFEEMAELSKKHGIEMFEKHDKAHLEAMEEMKTMMKDPVAVKQWYELKREEFEEAMEE